jgi:hypothetical protein
MENKFELMGKLMPFIDEYYSEKRRGKDVDLLDFSSWMTQKTRASQEIEMNGHAQSDESKFIEHPGPLLFHVDRMNKYLKAYLKSALKDSPLVSADDVGFLNSLMGTESLKKTEIIHIHVGEIPSGMEVIKRLLKNQLVEEFDDSDDKRAKRLRISAKGRKLYMQLISKIQKVDYLLKGNLTIHEVQMFQCLLEKIDQHHETIYPRRQAVLDTI